MVRNFFLILALLHLITYQSFTQGEIDEESNAIFKSEQTIGFSLNSTGFGFGYRYAKNINVSLKTLYNTEFAYLRHPSEFKTRSPYSGQPFVYGKLNLACNFRAGLGIQKELYDKRDKGAVSIRYFYTAGLSGVVLKPIYYELIENSSTNSDELVFRYVKFPENEHLNVQNINGRAEFYRGLNELIIVPGIHAQLGFTFEFGSEENIFQALESGVTVDLFPKKIPIMASENNYFYFLNLFIVYRFGNVIDDKQLVKLNKFDRLLLKK